jgi:hypothetical protein
LGRAWHGCSRNCMHKRLITIITPATIYVKVVIPAKSGIQNELDWMPDQVRHDILSVCSAEH